MAQIRTSRTFDAVFLVAVAAFLIWAAINRAALGDWVYFLTYEPTPKTTRIATDAGLSAHGRELFYRTNPQFTSEEAVAAECDIEQLGCITSKGQVFILDDPDKPSQTIVTAAHEMLHLAYRRLSADRKAELAPLINEAVARNFDIKELLKNETTADGRLDEAHSILGTEYAELPAALEQYYSGYFAERTKVIAAYAASLRER